MCSRVRLIPRQKSHPASVKEHIFRIVDERYPVFNDLFLRHEQAKHVMTGRNIRNNKKI